MQLIKPRLLLVSVLMLLSLLLLRCCLLQLVLFCSLCCIVVYSSSLYYEREPYKRGALISSYFPIYKGYRHHHLLLLPNLPNQAASDDVGQYRRCWRGVWYYHYIVQQLYAPSMSIPPCL